MSEDVEIELRGHKDVRAAFQDLREYLPKQLERSAVREAARFMLGLIVLVAPKLTGRLARNIDLKTRRTAGTIRARVVVNTRGKAGDPENAFYWRFLEKGWHTASGRLLQFPFVAGVFQSKNREAAQKVIDAVEQAIDRAELLAKRDRGG
jgi:hypothetical protein